MGQIEKRGLNTYRLVVECGFDNQKKRKRKYKTIKLQSNLTDKQIENEIIVQLDRFEKEVQKGTYLDGNITLNEFAEKWLKDYAEPNLKPKTFTHYKKLLKRILLALGHKKLDSIQPTQIMEFYKNLSEGGVRLDYSCKLKENVLSTMPDFEKRISPVKINPRTIKQLLNGNNTTKEIADRICTVLKIPVLKIFDIVDRNKKLSSTTVNHHHRLIRSMFNTAVQWQLILSNPVERVKPPRIEKKEAKYYDIAEVNQMLALLENEPIKYKVMIHIIIFCGLRLGELTALEWPDIDFDNETITISKQLQYLPEYGILDIDTTKTESGNRTIYIPSTLINLLLEYKRWQDNEKIKTGDKWVVSDKLFTQNNGKKIFPNSPSQWFNKFIKRNNLPSLTFHQLRHTNASLLIGQGTDIATVSKRLGHSDKTITLRIYTHALKQHDREAADKLGNLLSKKN